MEQTLQAKRSLVNIMCNALVGVGKKDSWLLVTVTMFFLLFIYNAIIVLCYYYSVMKICVVQKYLYYNSP